MTQLHFLIISPYFKSTRSPASHYSSSPSKSFSHRWTLSSFLEQEWGFSAFLVFKVVLFERQKITLSYQFVWHEFQISLVDRSLHLFCKTYFGEWHLTCVPHLSPIDPSRVSDMRANHLAQIQRDTLLAVKMPSSDMSHSCKCTEVPRCYCIYLQDLIVLDSGWMTNWNTGRFLSC